jgi:hypothetical protein
MKRLLSLFSLVSCQASNEEFASSDANVGRLRTRDSAIHQFSLDATLVFAMLTLIFFLSYAPVQAAECAWFGGDGAWSDPTN